MQPSPKSTLRARMRALRAPLLGAPALLPALDALPAWHAARTVAGFVAVRGELDVTPVLEAARARGVVVALPRVTGDGLVFHAWAGEPLAIGTYGIPEPAADTPVIAPEALDLLLVPGLAFDTRGRRLGQGGGYYDRVLAGPRGFALGVAWAVQIVDEVPADAWDQRVDALLTEAGWAWRGEG